MKINGEKTKTLEKLDNRDILLGQPTLINNRHRHKKFGPICTKHTKATRSA